MKFYRCNLCGQIIIKVKDNEIEVYCCNEPMEELIPIIQDEEMNNEIHLPKYTIKNNKVTVNIGEVPHPMTDTHYIEWILLVTNKGDQRKMLKPGNRPEATFYLTKGEKVEAVYAYCNIHSLWKSNCLGYCSSKENN